MDSIAPECTLIKHDYDKCFNEWFSEKFLKGDTRPPASCDDLFKKYQNYPIIEQTMDNHDQEVVREPFEDEEGVASLDHSPDNNDRDGCNLIDAQSIDYQNKISNRDNIYLDKQTCARANQIGGLYDGSESSSGDDDSSSSHLEDINFAETFGIKLKKRSSKRDMALSRLMKSAHIKESSKLEPKPLIATSITTDCIYHKGTFYQKGDIVALCDQDDGQQYFAQLTGFLQDQYCEKSASVNWLVPTKPTSREFFDPSAYRIGLEDVQLRKLTCMTFVRHCPHDYYTKKFFQSNKSSSVDCRAGQPIVRSRSNKDQNYIWTTMKPCRVPQIEEKQC